MAAAPNAWILRSGRITTSVAQVGRCSVVMQADRGQLRQLSPSLIASFRLLHVDTGRAKGKVVIAVK